VSKVIELVDGTEFRAKFTVEERIDGVFVATQWIAEVCLEVDRDVEEFETYSAALATMYANAFHYVKQFTQLRIRR
jgi:hypothetical protein